MLSGKSSEKNPRGEEGDARTRSVKKPKGLEVVDANIDDSMEEMDSKEMSPCVQKSSNMNLGVSSGRDRRVVSYMDKVLCLNGDDRGPEDEEEDWMASQRRDEEEEDMPDEVGAGMEEDPLCPIYVFSRKQHKEDCEKWRNALIVKLMGKKMATRFLMSRLLKLWSLVGTHELTDLDNGYLLIRFKDEKDCYHVLHERPWTVADHYVIVQRWRPFFDPYNDDVKKLAVWLRIPGLPTEFYTM